MNTSNITGAATYCLHILQDRISSNSSTRNRQIIEHSFYTIIVLPDGGSLGPKYVGASGFSNIIVNLIQLCAFSGLIYSN